MPDLKVIVKYDNDIGQQLCSTSFGRDAHKVLIQAIIWRRELNCYSELLKQLHKNMDNQFSTVFFKKTHSIVS